MFVIKVSGVLLSDESMHMLQTINLVLLGISHMTNISLHISKEIISPPQVRWHPDVL